MIRRTLNWLIIGAALGVIGSMWFGPSFIQSWKSSNAATGTACTAELVDATRMLVKLQVGVGLAVGVLAAIIVNLLASRRERSRLEREAQLVSDIQARQKARS
jgi:membrane protein implicated in regulation of membrane protease activity